MSSKRTPAPGFILAKLTLDILGIGLIVPFLLELVEVKAWRVHETEA